MADTRYVKGLDGVLDTLKQLPPEIVSKRGGPVRSSLRKAGVVFQKASQANVRAIVAEPNKDGRPSITTGTLEGAIIVSRRRPRGIKGEVYRVRVKQRVKHPRDPEKTANEYGGVLEFGDEDRPAKSWMRRAFESKKEEALTVFVHEMRKGIESATRRARKKGLF